MPTDTTVIPPIIAIEGLDGAGKSEVWQRLKGDPDFSEVYFTGELRSPVGEAILKDPGWRDDVLFKLFAFPADRAWLMREIRSRRSVPKVIVWERYVDSAIVYRGAEFDLGRSEISAERTAELNSLFPAAVRTLYLDVSVEQALRRKPGDPRLLAAVERRYRELRDDRGSLYITIDASGPLDEVVARTKAELSHVIQQLSL